MQQQMSGSPVSARWKQVRALKGKGKSPRKGSNHG
jgi:hypothetical protein